MRPQKVQPGSRLQFQPAFSASPASRAAIVQEEPVGSVQRAAFICGLSMLFLRMAIVPEILNYITHADLYLLYVVSPPAILGLIVSGGLSRAFKTATVWCWLGLAVCMLLSTPFSSWVGGSTDRVFSYLRVDFISLLVIAGTAVNWAQIRKCASAFALAGIVLIAVAATLAKAGGDGRLALDFNGTISNPNDLAAHIILLTPYVLWYATQQGRSAFVRYPLFGVIVYGLWTIMGTGSRGAMIATAVMCGYLLVRGGGTLRTVMILGVPLLMAAILVAAPQQVLLRLATLFVEQQNEVGAEAGESMASRSYLLQQSIKYTFEHPVFGVGPGQFATFEGTTMKSLGAQGNWHETHNTYTQISSECGIPALVLLLCALVGSARLVNRIYRRATAQNEPEVARLCSHYLLSLLGYCITITFLAHAYKFTLPALVGFGAAIYCVGDNYLKTRNLQA